MASSAFAMTPVALRIITSPQTVTAGACSGTTRVQAQDSASSPAPVSSVTVVSLAGSSNLKFYSNSTCSTRIYAVKIAAASATKAFYFKSTVVGMPTITASAAGLASASQTEVITPAAATQVMFRSQPRNVLLGALIAPPVQVALSDRYGNTVSSGAASIVISIASNPSSGTLSGLTTRAAIDGVATFSDLRVNATGLGYTLRALSPNLASATSTAFNVTAPGSTGASGAAVPGSNSKTVFVPGRGGVLGGKANYASAPGVTANTINLGIIVPMDGPAAQLGRPLYRATQAYVNGLNARGGIHGRLVQLFLQTACINCEDENLLAAKALVEQKHVFAIVNTYMNTYAFGAALNYLNQQHVPLIEGWTGIGPESETWSADQTPWNVYYTVRNEDAVQIYADWLDTVMSHWASAGKLQFPNNPHWVATVGLDVTQDRKRAAEFKRVWEAKGAGYKVVSQQYVAAQEEVVTRMDSFISAMKNAQANGAFSASNITMVFGMQAANRKSGKANENGI